jgi:FlaA1/EpsC-like NDP-sugar epimerase
MTKRIILNFNFAIMLACDALLLYISWIAAYMVRFDFSIPESFYIHLWAALPLVIVTKLLCLIYFNCYRGMWRFTSLADLINIIKATIFGSIIAVVGIALVFRFENFPRSIVLIDLCFSVLAVAGIRLGIRLFYRHWIPSKSILSLSIPGYTQEEALPKRKKIKLLIIGAGNCGEKIFREIQDNPQLNYKVVGFLDDSPSKIGRMIHGRPVLGIVGDLNRIITQTRAKEALIAIPSASSQEMRRIVSLCKESGIHFKTVPGYGELIDGKLSVNVIREVAYRDLLHRETVKLDEKTISDYIHGRQVLVTGAGGSIGSELSRQICRFNPATIVLFERAESPLYEIDLALRKTYGHLRIVPVLGDIRDKNHLRKVFGSLKPQTVFHAAAYKHVPMLEGHPWKAIENNVLGTLNVVDVSNEFDIERFVLVSTDKAVRAANVMGASKRMAEMIAVSHNECKSSRTLFMAVRFGNVVGSVGSVVPLFKRQIEEGGPVTVTHPEVTRYFMTIREASQMILQAGAMGQGGEIFILDMGTPVKIVDVARDLIRLSGFEPDVDIKIEFIGLRPGEKLFEELITGDENAQPTQHPKILMLKGSTCDIDLLNGKIRDLTLLATTQDAAGIRAKLQEIVLDYCPSSASPGLRHVA